MLILIKNRHLFVQDSETFLIRICPNQKKEARIAGSYFLPGPYYNNDEHYCLNNNFTCCNFFLFVLLRIPSMEGYPSIFSILGNLFVFNSTGVRNFIFCKLFDEGLGVFSQKDFYKKTSLKITKSENLSSLTAKSHKCI